jgi:hypothetical protein
LCEVHGTCALEYDVEAERYKGVDTAGSYSGDQQLQDCRPHRAFFQKARMRLVSNVCSFTPKPASRARALPT